MNTQLKLTTGNARDFFIILYFITKHIIRQKKYIYIYIYYHCNIRIDVRFINRRLNIFRRENNKYSRPRDNSR